MAAYDDNVIAYSDKIKDRYSDAMYGVNEDMLKSDDEKKAAVDQVRGSLPDKQNVTDKSDPPQWSWTFRPRDLVYVDSHGLMALNESAWDGMIVIGNTTYNLHKDYLWVYENSLDYYRGRAVDLRFAYNNASFKAAYLEEKGVCLPGDDYIWGFSSLMLFTFCMITIAVALILITLHYDAYFNSAADRYKFSISPYRDVLDLAEELRRHYGSAETAEMPAKELDTRMRKEPVAVGLETGDLHRSRGARRKQKKAERKALARSEARKREGVVDGRAAAAAGAEESLMSMGTTDARLQSEMEMAKLPARVASRSTSGS